MFDRLSTSQEIFEQRREAFVKEPDKAVTTHQAKIRLIKDHYKEAQVPGGYTIACDENGAGPSPAPPLLNGREVAVNLDRS